MFYKLAINNIKKSYKDYLIYFVTLTLGIMLFYLFNSIESQKVMLKLTEVKSKSLETVFGAMNFISVFISLALAFLMLYANRFLIKRRKKEMGIYLLLGMGRMKVSFLLVLETIIIGAISLVVGTILGVIGSHFFSLITARMFLVDVGEFQFIFSPKAALKTTLFFGLIFGVDILLNTLSISRLKLINLLYARRRNQELHLKNIWLNRSLFIVAVLCLFAAYYCITVNRMMSFDVYFKSSIMLGSVGTLMFFMSLSGIMIPLIRRNIASYYRDLNIFTLRQVGSKINTTYMLMAVVCIMLLIAIGTFSTGMGMAEVMGNTLEEHLPFDDGFMIWNQGEPIDYENILSKEYLESVDYCTVETYNANINMTNLLTEAGKREMIPEDIYYFMSFNAVSINDYNSLLALMGEEPIELSDDGFYLNYNIDKIDEDMKWLAEKGGNIAVMGKTFTLEGINKRTLYNAATDNGTLILPEEYLEDYQPNQSIISVNYREMGKDLYSDNETILINYPGFTLSKEVILSEALGTKTILSYFAIYVGIVFIMSSVVILALQLLTEVSDNVERYQLLMKLGVEERAIKKSLFLQISLYFMLPLALGIIHSYVGLKVSTEAVRILGNLDIFSNLITTAIFVIGIYGAYFIVTYATMKAIVLGQR